VCDPRVSLSTNQRSTIYGNPLFLTNAVTTTLLLSVSEVFGLYGKMNAVIVGIQLTAKSILMFLRKDTFLTNASRLLSCFPPITNFAISLSVAV